MLLIRRGAGRDEMRTPLLLVVRVQARAPARRVVTLAERDLGMSNVPPED